MNRHLLALFLVTALSTLTSGAQDPSASGQAKVEASVEANRQQVQASGNTSASSNTSGNPGSANAGLASGTAFNTSLTQPVDAKKAKPGDRVEARTTESVKSGRETVLPKGTKLVGHVTQASARAKGDSQSALAITFDHAILKDGSEVPLNVNIQALASAETMVRASESAVDSMNTGSAGASGTTHGALVGVTSTAGGAVGGAANTASRVENAAGRTVDTTASTTTQATGGAQGTMGGLNAAGQLTSSSRGVFGLNSLNLDSTTAGTTQGTVITSADKNIHLASGTRMLMVTQAAATTSNR